MQIKSLLLTGTIAGIAFAGPAFAAKNQAAQTAPAVSADQVEAMQQQIAAMQAQVAYMKRQLELMQEKNPPNAAPAPKVVQSGSNKFSIESADGQYSAALTGRIHLDVGDYASYDPKSKATSPADLNSGFNARRARIGVVGKAAGDFTYGFIYDAGGTTDATPTGIQTAQVGYTGIKNMIFEIGYSDTFFTLDEATSSNDTLFMERASPANVATGVNAGDFRSNVGGRWFNDRLWVGAYVTGPANLQVHNQGESVGAFQRIAYQVLSEPEYTLHIGGAIDEIIKAPANGGSAASTTTKIDTSTGVPVLVTSTSPNVATFALSDRPELRIDTTSLLNTGQLGVLGHPVSGGYIADVELAGNYGPLYWQGEYMHYSIDRDGLDTADFDGGYGEASYTLTGEAHKYNKATGAYNGIVPAHAFDPSQGFWGAWEVAGRVSYVDLTSNLNRNLALTSQPNAVNGGKQTVYTAGLNWYPNSYMRFMLNYIHADYDKANTGSSGILGSNIGASLDAIALRTQVAW
ncbi:MAG TPA: porin [Alphaproteobacteria bacterium]|nr:porin [Alphaproteobacteria bacterium]